MSHPYAELHCLSNFSFLRGASHPEELVARAHELGYTALAITDECSVAGVVRAHMAAKGRGLALIIGSEFRLEDGLKLVVLAASREGYAQLCGLITRGRRAAEKGGYRLNRADLASVPLNECLALWLPGPAPDAGEAGFLAERFPDRLWIAVELLLAPDDAGRLAALRELGRRLKLPLVAAGDVHMHRRGRRALQDTLTAIRLGTPLQRLGTALFPNGERQIEHELKLIEELRYEAYFLTVWDLVRFARIRGILCQGRGSAANSAVCYCLGVTSVDPERIDLLFERFVSRERNEAPDIDVDFEHERREEVLAVSLREVRPRAGRHDGDGDHLPPRSAVRDVGKALGLSLDRVDAAGQERSSTSRASRPPRAVPRGGASIPSRRAGSWSRW
jgi:DNA polymerase III alpha subunit